MNGALHAFLARVAAPAPLTEREEARRGHIAEIEAILAKLTSQYLLEQKADAKRPARKRGRPRANQANRKSVTAQPRRNSARLNHWAGTGGE